MKDLAERLAALSPEQRALLERRLEERGIAIPKGSAIRPIPGREALEYHLRQAGATPAKSMDLITYYRERQVGG